MIKIRSSKIKVGIDDLGKTSNKAGNK